MNIISSYDLILFDCDSTLTIIEGIDELAKKMGLAKKITELTNAAMNGDLPLHEVYSKRLNLIKPDRFSIKWLGQHYIDNIIEDAASVISILQAHGKEIHIVSGGILQAIQQLGESLKIPQKNIHAIDVYFDNFGNYDGFDEASPLCQQNGKALICQKLMSVKGSAIMIGDGATDLEVSKVGATVIGFGGIIHRTLVEQNADYYIKENKLTPVLDLCLANDKSQTKCN